MCNFFSFLSDGRGNIYYHDNKIRKQILSGESNLRIDSHASIAEYHFKNSHKEDDYNKWEYNPLTKELTLDHNNLGFDDRNTFAHIDIDGIVKECVPELILNKPIVHPFKDRKFNGDIEEVKLFVKEWYSVRASMRASVWASVGDSVWASVRDSVWDSVGDSVWASMRYSVWDSVWASMRDSVWDSVRDSVRYSMRDSVWDSVRYSVWDSVGAYISTWFLLDKWLYIKHEKGKNPFESMARLWDMGVVPVFVGDKVYLITDKGIIDEYKFNN